jgi:hypothetical protein
MCDGDCLTECKCRYMRGTDDCHCYKYKHDHIRSATKRFCVIDECEYSCSLIDCKNYNYCKDSYPLHMLINGQCENCDAFKVTFTNEIDNCFICFEDKYLIETECKHRFCLNCLLKLNWDKEADDNPCPMCRKNIDFTD